MDKGDQHKHRCTQEKIIVIMRRTKVCLVGTDDVSHCQKKKKSIYSGNSNSERWPLLV